MRAAARMESPQTTSQEMTLAQYEAHFNYFALENFPNAFVWRVSAALQHSLYFLITLEGKLMFIHNSLLKHPLEMASVSDTNTALQSFLSLSIREAALNICGEEGKRCCMDRLGRICSAEDGSLSIPQGSIFGPEDSQCYWKYSHSPAGLQLRTTQIIHPAELESKPSWYEIFLGTIQ